MRAFWVQSFDFLPAYKRQAYELARTNLLERRFW